MRRIVLLSLLLIGALVLALPLFAQTTSTVAQPIAYGETVNGVLTSDSLAPRYTFTGSAGDTVTISLDAVDNAFDAVLRVLNASGQQVAYNDDRRGSRNSEISGFVLPASGEYTIVASSLNGRQTGAFVLTLRQGVPPTATPMPTATFTPFPTTVPTQLAPAAPIAYGDSVRGELTDIAPSVLYTFTGSAGDAVRVTMDGDNGIDTTLRILNPNGDEVAYNDDSRGSLSSQIELYVLPVSGEYTIVAGGFANSARGTYTLLFEQVEAPEVLSGQVIEYGQTVRGELNLANLAINYTFSGTEGDVVTITLDAVDNRFDAFLRLLGVNGETLITNDDSRGSLNSQIASFTLPASGEYTIVATSLSGRQTGAFLLTLETGAPPAVQPTQPPFGFPTPTPAPMTSTGMIEYGQTVRGQLTTAALTSAYTFSGGEGDTVLITLDAVDNSFDTTLTLNDPSGSQLAYNDDSRSSLNSQIGPFTLPTSGQYTLVVNSYRGNATGAFTLSLRLVTSQPIAFGEPLTLSLDDVNREFFLTFSASNGDLIDIFVDSSRVNPVDTALNLLDPSGFTAISDEDSGSGSNPEINGYLVYTNGTHTIQLFAQGDQTDMRGDVTVTLLRRVPPSLDEGAQTLRFSSSVQQQVVSFSGVSGERVRLTFVIEGGRSSSSFSASVRQGDGEVSSLSSYNAGSTSMEIVVPVDGDLSVVVSEYSYSNTAVTVTLERLGS